VFWSTASRNWPITRGRDIFQLPDIVVAACG
jgi:hypothetical protein